MSCSTRALMSFMSNASNSMHVPMGNVYHVIHKKNWIIKFRFKVKARTQVNRAGGSDMINASLPFLLSIGSFYPTKRHLGLFYADNNQRVFLNQMLRFLHCKWLGHIICNDGVIFRNFLRRTVNTKFVGCTFFALCFCCISKLTEQIKQLGIVCLVTYGD